MYVLSKRSLKKVRNIICTFYRKNSLFHGVNKTPIFKTYFYQFIKNGVIVNESYSCDWITRSKWLSSQLIWTNYGWCFQLLVDCIVVMQHSLSRIISDEEMLTKAYFPAEI